MSAARPSKNVLGGPLAECSSDPLTGYSRNGACECFGVDEGQHTVCCVMTIEFLDFSLAVGNDLTTPRPEFMFPGLKPGDRWCVCVSRWAEALQHGVAPKVVLEATHEMALEFVSLDELRTYAIV